MMRKHFISSTSSPRFFFFNDTATTEIYTLSLHDALPIFEALGMKFVSLPLSGWFSPKNDQVAQFLRSEEHTSELQSRSDLVCRLLLEKKKETIPWIVRIRSAPSIAYVLILLTISIDAPLN